MTIKAIAIFLKTETYPKGYLHSRIFGYGPDSGNPTYKHALELAQKYIESHKAAMWYVTKWRLKKVLIEVK